MALIIIRSFLIAWHFFEGEDSAQEPDRLIEGEIIFFTLLILFRSHTLL